MEGMMMGGALAGPYGAGGGLVIGLLAGLFTADSHYAQQTNQIQTEQAKDKLLEAQIEQELERQRQLEAQLLNPPANQNEQNQAGPPQRTREPDGVTLTTVAMTDRSNAVASLSKKENFTSSAISPFKNVEVRDINADGLPDLWIYYSPLRPGEVVRQEEATHWDGRVDSWSYFKDGKLVRRDLDTKGRGMADTVYYYENDKITKEERDERGTGQVSFRAIYQNGRRAKLEEDTQGTGKLDRWIYFDTSQGGEIVLKEEQDLNADGLIDVWAYYENGRLVRRDVSAVGMELLFKQQSLLTFPTERNEGLRAGTPPIGSPSVSISAR
jgi:hypothetical protein